MGVGQQRLDRQLVGAAGQVGAAGAADLSVERLPPGAGRDEMTVALACEGAHAVTDGQAAQAQEFGDRHTIGAGQAWAALAAAFHPQVLGVEPAFPGAGLAPSLPGRREPGKGGGPGQIAGLLGPQPQGGDPLINQKAVGQLQGGGQGAVRQRFGRWCIKLPLPLPAGEMAITPSPAAGQGPSISARCSESLSACPRGTRSVAAPAKCSSTD